MQRERVQPPAGLPRQRGMELKHRLYRSRGERMISGVAGGLADYVDLDPTIVRLLWLFAFLTTGPLALVLYFLCVMIIPREPDITLV
jgi:phage shock protein C